MLAAFWLELGIHVAIGFLPQLVILHELPGLDRSTLRGLLGYSDERSAFLRLVFVPFQLVCSGSAELLSCAPLLLTHVGLR